jgi:hypothetical protein
MVGDNESMAQMIKRELEQMRVKDKEYDREVQKKMQGFLL